MMMSLEESLKTVTSVESRRDFASYVPRDGISLKFLLDHLANAKHGSKPIRTMYDLEAYVLELTSRCGACSFTELLKHHQSYSAAVVDTATYFVSFAYSTDFEVILSALDKYRRKQGADDLFVWVSILSINQHFGRKHGEEAAVVYPQGWFKKAFKDCIPAIQNVLFVMSPLHRPVALQRLWCIYELYLTISDNSCALDVVLSEDDEQYLITHLLQDSQSVLKYINGVDAERAKSSNPEQEQKLRTQIVALSGGYTAIDEAVRERLRLWFADTATGYIEEKREEYKKDRPGYITLLRMVGKMLLEAGRHEKADRLMREDILECRRLYGSKHINTAVGLNNLGNSLKDQGKNDEAKALYEEAIAIMKSVGKDDRELAFPLNNLAELLRAQGRYEEARPLYEEAIAFLREAFGDEDTYLATCLNNLALLLTMQGSYEHAMAMHYEALAIRRKKLDSMHPDVAQSLNNIGELLRERGQHRAARPMHDEALAIRRKAFGREHAMVAESLNNIALLFSAEGNHIEAEQLFRQAMAIDKKVYGDKHPLFASDLTNLAAMLSRQGKFDEANAMFKAALQIRLDQFGPMHVEVAQTYWNWADSLHREGNIAEARLKWRSACVSFEGSLGPSNQQSQLCTLWGVAAFQVV